jgi:hypothetical protein
MKSSSLSARLSTIAFSGLAVCTLALGSIWLTPAAPAFAAPAAPPAGSTPNYAGLDKAYEREQSARSQQSNNLTKANGIVAKVQAYITNQKAKGLDTSALEAALSTYQTQLGTAQSSHDTAASVLSGHAGFDGSGNVTDAGQARQTVISARQSLLDAHTALAQGGKDLRAAIQQFRDTKVQQNRLATEQKGLAQQQTTLDNANGIVAKVQTYIANQKAKGQDTSALEAALATFQQQLSTAQASHTSAANLLTTHAGFDNSGNVTDPTQAHQTLMDAHQALTDAHNVLKQAGQDLRKALQDYRDTHKVTPVAAPTATPGA